MHTQVEIKGLRKHASQMGLTASCIACLGKDSKEFVGKPPPDENVISEDLFPRLAHSEITFSQPPFFLRAGDLFHWIVCLGRPRQHWVLITMLSNEGIQLWFSQVRAAELFFPALQFLGRHWASCWKPFFRTDLLTPVHSFVPQVLVTIYWLGKAANSCTSYSGTTLNLKEFEGLLAQMRKVTWLSFLIPWVLDKVGRQHVFKIVAVLQLETLTGEEHLIFFQRTWVRFLAPTISNSSPEGYDVLSDHCGHIYRENTHSHKLFKVFDKMIMIMVVCWGTVLTQHMCSRKEPFVSSHTIFVSWLSQHFKVWILHSLENGRPELAPAVISRESPLCWRMAWHSTELRACALQEVRLELNSVMSYKSKQLLCSFSQRLPCLPVRCG